MTPSNQSTWSLVKDILEAIGDGRFGDIDLLASSGRLHGADVRALLADYGRTAVRPPADAELFLDVVEIVGSNLPSFSIRIPLWTAEEGRSDLTLELTRVGDRLEIDDLHVL